MNSCARTSCKAEAVCSIKAIIPAKKTLECNASPIEVYCGLHLCKVCATRLTLAEIITDGMKRHVSEIMGVHNNIPDFSKSELHIISSDDVHLLLLESSNSTIH